ncbi:iron chelate uptake ABC transporter family permease subunit, partial [uncultured Anaerococcus sp.]|uniref:iron chelate uptake ABC transporter family permease subunit n=1 Tax=uncultured Anaerococcus sp. TaxID=293428 RepID=UPI00280C0998
MQNLIIGIQKRKKRITLFSLLFLLIIISLSFFVLLIGDESYSFSTLIKVLNNETVPGASFSIMEIRLPKLLAGIIAGWSFGLAGFIFQTMLRNSLASPDIIGVTSSSSIAAVFCILVLKTNNFTTGIISIACGL